MRAELEEPVLCEGCGQWVDLQEVVACRKCNEQRGASEEAALGIEELRRRSAAGRATPNIREDAHDR